MIVHTVLAHPQFLNHRGMKSGNDIGRQVSKALECGRNGRLWVTLLWIGIKPEKGLGFMRLIQQSKVSTLKLLQPACLCLELLRVLEKSGLGEPFGKASLANTVFRLGRFISMGNWSTRTGGWYRYPFEGWPDEAWERGLSRPLAKRGKNWGRARIPLALDKSM